MNAFETCEIITSVIDDAQKTNNLSQTYVALGEILMARATRHISEETKDNLLRRNEKVQRDIKRVKLARKQLNEWGKVK